MYEFATNAITSLNHEKSVENNWLKLSFSLDLNNIGNHELNIKVFFLSTFMNENINFNLDVQNRCKLYPFIP